MSVREDETLNEAATVAANSEAKAAGFEAGAPIYGIGLQYLRASGLAQARLQLAVISGNRRRALREIDRLVAIDRQLARISECDQPDDGGVSGESIETHLASQQRAIASEKFALMAAVELPRLSDLPESAELLLGEEHEIPVVEDITLGRRLMLTGIWLAGLILLVTVTAIAIPALAG